MPSPQLTETVACGASVLHIYGRRSSKGWRLSRHVNPASEPAVVVPLIKGKDDAVRTALDCCAEEPGKTFILKPAT